MKKTLLIFWMFSLYGLSFPQGAFLEKGMSGFDASATVNGSNDKSYLGQARLGFSNFGIVDFGVSLGEGKTHLTKNTLGPGQNFFAFVPDLSVYLVKQDTRVPISLALNASVESDNYFSDYLAQNYLTMSGTVFSLGGSMYRKFALNNTVQLVASASARYRFERTFLSEYRDVISREDNDYPQLTVGCDALIKEPYNNALRIGAAVGYDRSGDKDNFSASLTVGMEIPWTVAWTRWRHPRHYIIIPAEETKESPTSGIITTPTSPSDTFTINIPNSRGGFVAVKVVKYKDGYLGPQGEFYPGRPTVEQLKALYGD